MTKICRSATFAALMLTPFCISPAFSKTSKDDDWCSRCFVAKDEVQIGNTAFDRTYTNSCGGPVSVHYWRAPGKDVPVSEHDFVEPGTHTKRCNGSRAWMCTPITKVDWQCPSQPETKKTGKKIESTVVEGKNKVANKEDEKKVIASYIKFYIESRKSSKYKDDLTHPIFKNTKLINCNANFTECIRDGEKACYTALDILCRAIRTSCATLNETQKMNTWAESKPDGIERIKARAHIADWYDASEPGFDAQNKFRDDSVRALIHCVNEANQRESSPSYPNISSNSVRRTAPADNDDDNTASNLLRNFSYGYRAGSRNSAPTYRSAPVYRAPAPPTTYYPGTSGGRCGINICR